MRSFKKIGVLAAVLGWVCVAARADTVYRKDGISFTGEVTQTDGGVSVQTKAGVIVIPDSEVDHIEQGAAPAPPKLISPSVHPAAPAVTSGVHSSAKPVDPKTLQALLDQAQAALAVGEYPAARDAFSDALTLDPKNVVALHGLGASYMYLQDFAKAKGPMEKAIACTSTPDRALVLNLAVLEIAVRNPMRAVKVVRDYMTSHSAVMDEPMLNAMAIALEQADAQAQKMPLFTDSVQFYLTRNAQLEAAVPGQKRWGLEWLPSDAVDKKITTNAAAERKADRADRDLTIAEDRVNRAQATLDQSIKMTAKGDDQYYIERAQHDLDSAVADRNQKLDEYNAAIAQIDRPKYPTTLALVAMSNQAPPEVHGMTPQQVAKTQDADAAAAAVATDKPKTSGRHPKNPPKTTVADTGNSSGTGAATPATPPPPAPPAITVVQVKPTVVEKVRITNYGVGFPVAPNMVVTAAAPLQQATDIELQTATGNTLKAEVVRIDEASGLALLRVSENTLNALVLSPAAFTGGKLECASFPVVNIFMPAGERIQGSALVPKEPWRVRLDQHPRLSGGPLLVSGKVVGVELASRDSDSSAIPAATLDQLRKLLGSDVPVQTSTHVDPADCVVQVLATHESQ